MRRFLLALLAALTLPVGADAADRYWVGGTGQWNTLARWSSSSGGAGGASIPTSSDNCFFNASSGGGTVTVNFNVSAGICANLVTTGFNGTITRTASGQSLNLYGNTITIGSGTTFAVPIVARGTNAVLTSNGVNLAPALGGTALAPFGTNARLTLADDLTVAGIVVSSSTIFSNGGHNITSDVFQASSGSNVTLTGPSTLTLTSARTDTLKINSGASLTLSQTTVVLNNASATNKTFDGGGKTYATVRFVGGGTGAFVVAGSNTIGTIELTSAPVTVNFTAGTTTTISTGFSVDGISGGPNILQSTSSGSAWNLSKSSGAVAANYVTLKDSHAAGGATFTANNSSDAGGNTGWTFTAPPSANTGGMFQVFP